jgi:hypothetical protein
LELQVTFTWYVTFELPKTLKHRGRRSLRTTQKFQTETEAKEFAQVKCAEGLIVNAGTINPVSPRQAIAWRSMPTWLEEAREKETVEIRHRESSFAARVCTEALIVER